MKATNLERIRIKESNKVRNLDTQLKTISKFENNFEAFNYASNLFSDFNESELVKPLIELEKNREKKTFIYSQRSRFSRIN